MEQIQRDVEVEHIQRCVEVVEQSVEAIRKNTEGQLRVDCREVGDYTTIWETPLTWEVRERCLFSKKQKHRF